MNQESIEEDRKEMPQNNANEKSEEHESLRQAKVFDALLTIVRPLSHVAGVAIVLVGVATTIGWAGLRGYFSGVGAPWAIWMVDPAQFVTQSLGLLLAVFSGLVLLLFIYVDSPPFDTWKRVKFSFKISLVGVALYALHYSLDKWIFDSYKSHWNLAAYVAFASAGFLFALATVKIIVESINEPRSTMKMALVYMVVVLAASSVPSWYQSKGRKEIQRGELSYVEVSGLEPCQWRLVRPLSREQLLLVEDSNLKVFKIIDLSEVSAIRPHGDLICKNKMKAP